MLVEASSLAWGALVGGAAVGAAGSLVGDVLNAILSGGRAKKAFNRQKTIMKNQVQWRVKDMIKAGINPMLAAYTGSAQPASVAMAPTPDFGSGMEKAGELISRIPGRLAELKQTAAQTEYTAAQTELSQAAASKTRQDERTSRADEALKGQQLVQSAAQTGLLKGPERARLEALAEQLLSSSQLLQSQRFAPQVLQQMLKDLVGDDPRKQGVVMQLFDRMLEGLGFGAPRFDNVRSGSSTRSRRSSDTRRDPLGSL